MFNNKSILITGGTGSFGNAFANLTLNKYKLKKLIIFSRDEMKQWEMNDKFKSFNNIKFVIGDVRDKDALLKVMQNVD